MPNKQEVKIENETALLRTCYIIQNEIDKLMNKYARKRRKDFNFSDKALDTIRILIETRNRIKNHFNLN